MKKESSRIGKLLKKLNLNEIAGIYLLGLAVLLISFFAFGILSNKNANKRINEFSSSTSTVFNFKNKVTDVLVHLDKALSQQLLFTDTGKEIYRYQAFREMDKANISFNVLQEIIFGSFNESNTADPIINSRVLINSFEEALISDLTVGANGLQFSVTGINDVVKDGTYDSLQTVEEENAYKQILEENALDKIQLYQRLENNLFQLSAIVENTYMNSVSNVSEKRIISWGALIGGGSIFVIIMLITFRFINRNVNNILGRIDSTLEMVSGGEIPEKLHGDFGLFDETAKHTSSMIDYMEDVSKFAEKLGEGEFTFEFEAKGENDLIGNSLMQMRNKLLDVAEQDKVRNWMNEGQTKFNDIIRQNSDNFEELTDLLISNLVKYVDGTQGTMYIIDDNDENNKFLELKSAYAYDRKKFIEKKLQIGEGLAGQVFLEGKTLRVENVGEDHFDIKSGLGTSKPSSVIIVPLKDEDNVEGIVEIAAFKEFKDFEVEFVESIGSTIASSLRSVKINDNTKRLLAETRQREEEMKAQEEELRQNMEELAATQEQLERARMEEGSQADDVQKRIDTLMELLDLVPFDVFMTSADSKYVLVNESFAKAHGSSAGDMIGKDDLDFYEEAIAREHMQEDKEVIESGETLIIPAHEWTDLTGETKIVRIVKSPIEIKEKDEVGVVGMIIDASVEENLKKTEEQLLKEIETLKKQLKG